MDRSIGNGYGRRLGGGGRRGAGGHGWRRMFRATGQPLWARWPEAASQSVKAPPDESKPDDSSSFIQQQLANLKQEVDELSRWLAGFRQRISQLQGRADQ